MKLIFIQEGADLTKIKEEYTHKDAMVQGIAFAKDLISRTFQMCYIPSPCLIHVKGLEALGLKT